jgi:hypothetical protein
MSEFFNQYYPVYFSAFFVHTLKLVCPSCYCVLLVVARYKSTMVQQEFMATIIQN